jgi:hypothetical protein
MKSRLRIVLTARTEQQLTQAARRPGTNRSDIIEKALIRFLDPQAADTTTRAMVRRLDQLSRTQDYVSRDVRILAEALGHFIRLYLIATPPFVGRDAAAQQALGAKRFDQFIEQLGRKLSAGDSFVAKFLHQSEENHDNDASDSFSPANDANSSASNDHLIATGEDDGEDMPHAA